MYGLESQNDEDNAGKNGGEGQGAGHEMGWSCGYTACYDIRNLHGEYRDLVLFLPSSA